MKSIAILGDTPMVTACFVLIYDTHIYRSLESPYIVAFMVLLGILVFNISVGSIAVCNSVWVYSKAIVSQCIS